MNTLNNFFQALSRMLASINALQVFYSTYRLCTVKFIEYILNARSEFLRTNDITCPASR